MPADRLCPLSCAHSNPQVDAQCVEDQSNPDSQSPNTICSLDTARLVPQPVCSSLFHVTGFGRQKKEADTSDVDTDGPFQVPSPQSCLVCMVTDGISSPDEAGFGQSDPEPCLV